MIEQLKDFLENKEKMRNLRLGIATVLALGLGILYFGFFEQLSLELIFALEVGALGIIAYISYMILWWEIGEYGYEIECEDNEYIKDVSDNINQEIIKINEDFALIYIDNYNEKHQHIANITLTNNKINNLERKIRKYKFKKKDYSKLEYKKEFLQENPLFNYKYKPIEYDNLISISGKSKSKKYQNAEFGYNPKIDGIYWASLFNLFKMVGLGLNAVVPFIIKDWKALITFYAILIISLSVMSLKRYFKIRLKTSTRFLDNLRNQHRLLLDINKNNDLSHDNKIDDIEVVEEVETLESENMGESYEPS